jgi:hypothetical protein
MRRFSFVLTLLLLTLGATFVRAQDSGTLQSDSVSLTVYNEGTALVQDRRTFNLQSGTNTLDFTDVAASIDATSVSFKSLTDPTGTTVLEQNYVYDLVDSAALLNRYIDQPIEITTTTANNGTETISGQLLSGVDDIILRKDDGQVIVISRANVRDIRFPDLPGGLITRPTLRWLVQSANTGSQQVELTYLTGGISWTADYILLLATDNQSLGLNGWITLNNSSGAAFKDAKLKLVAGELNRLPQPQQEGLALDKATSEAVPAAPPVEQRNFSEYKLYEISRPVTVGNNETKQVEFVTAADVPANTFFVYDGGTPLYGYYSPITDQYYGQTGITTVQNWLEFTTGKETGLDAALPAGRIRVYQEDVDGAALLIGENTINHTPKGETVRLLLGNAFDLVGEHTQTDFKFLSSTVLQETYTIKLRNHKEDQTVEIRVPEHLFRWSNWQILSASDDYKQLDSGTIEFRAQVKPGEEKVITYTVQYSWPG